MLPFIIPLLFLISPVNSPELRKTRKGKERWKTRTPAPPLTISMFPAWHVVPALIGFKSSSYLLDGMILALFAQIGFVQFGLTTINAPTYGTIGLSDFLSVLPHLLVLLLFVGILLYVSHQDCYSLAASLTSLTGRLRSIVIRKFF